ncbi:bifunctional N-acetylglucosamine-1-phosphate uridyltransferase/glucosamine-1-phosphate acetyltransferase [Bacillus coahuilensis p1.1.43]|uniref:Bifunctional protein GlmU n=1 Tax=Bacillus coahuilensis p1.1.43 TaxID=1150625 RepID=A0A147K4W2_9BACI|nr:bifunctional UDP-N-acetylglucosamine diphosphorylase/glucosamine-1-phosphate N-acetyltransferase GlmU [Bacillus coahuilensis]KUP04561.1 bifunctional N-acetylglucosamine-1-phosphate uridyltransferase/glucosamine-1-phosphate acetyltransferase [Bacillus coahuilensis p1.1.43]
MNRYAIILAAGQGTRMKSKLYKVLHPVCGKPMVEHVVDQLSSLSIDQTVTIVGFGAEKVQSYLEGKSDFALQKEQLGTAHAVMQAEELLQDKKGITLVICGDTPLIKTSTMEALMEEHTKLGAKATVLTDYAEDPTGYGRVIRNEDGHVERIVEQKDASEAEKSSKRNYGYILLSTIPGDLKKVKNDNAQGEYYLPDVMEILKSEGQIVAAYQTSDLEETLGVNDRVALSQAETIMRKRINEAHMRNGVTIIDPASTYIEADVQIGKDTVILPNTYIQGLSVIGEDCLIGPGTEIKACKIGNATTIKQSVAHDSEIGDEVTIGPFAHIRPASSIHNEVKIGNFVEVKKSEMGPKSKASHLSYIGDAKVGSDVNLGCGSITVNYDGKNKHLTTIEDGAFIGCNSNLIAPVTVGKGAYVAAGSTVTEDVPSEALTIARARQVNKEDYVKNLNLK